MSNLMKLRDEHAQLVQIVDRLAAVIAHDVPPPPADLGALRKELSSTLIAHLKAEDWMLYPRLMECADPTVAQTARTFCDEMGGLASAYMNYAEKWGAGAIERDWAGYCRDTAAIAEALTQRIVRENCDLYPLLEQLDRAA